ncbi:MAG: T9SS type A sorting domain-containing protein [Bacteroidales bacterium]|jgi:hypothetical protein|nr:T9SS type A sorting domain-containing protein [Bacteroidales bacterium]
MKHKIYTLIVALCASAISAHAQDAPFIGNYFGSLNLAVLLPEADNVQLDERCMNISAEDADATTFTLSFYHFSITQGSNFIDLGTITVGEITAATENGVTTLSLSHNAAGPDVDTVGDGEHFVPTSILINSATVDASGNLSVSVSAFFVNADNSLSAAANATFTGAWCENCPLPSGISTAKQEKVAVYPTITSNILNIISTENAAYSIHTPSGAVAQQGSVTGGTISVATLPAGVYVLTVNGRSARFVKK